MEIKNCKIDENGIFIPTETLVELKNHYEAVKTHCQHTKSERLAKYYEGKTDVFGDIIANVKDEQKKMKTIVTKTTVV